MSTVESCPNAGKLKALLKGTLPESERAALWEHVEACAACQAAIEPLVDSDASLEALSRDLKEATDRENDVLTDVLDRLKSHQPPEADDNAEKDDCSELGFLEDSSDPESLGRLGAYEIREVIGRGGMGLVLRGHDAKLNRVVAIKVLAPQLAASALARKRFLREARAAAAINHPHVVGIFAIEESGLPYLAMEYVDGESLQQKINTEGPLELKEILRIGKQIAAGLAAAHEQGLIHRDVKPSNVLLENGVERVKLTDFGLARAADDVSITWTGEVAGTPEYMSPEQADAGTVDPRSDLFSLGSVLYAMCTGRSPFRAESTMRAMRRVCENRPRAIQEVNPDVPWWLADLVDKLLAKDPDQRIQTAAEVEDLLGDYLAHVQDPGGTSPPRPVFSRKPKRRSRPWLILAATVLVLAGGLGLTEATGVTHLADTVIRIATGEGTLVIEVDDPSVEISLDGEELSITGAGIEELKLRPGEYRFRATKDGEPVKQELVRISRGGRRLVSVTGIPGAGAALAPAEPDAFVVLDPRGSEVDKLDTLAEAVRGSNPGDTIEIRGNGPFLADPIEIGSPLTIRAADGSRPVIRFNPNATLGPGKPLLASNSLLVLEGLDLECSPEQPNPVLVWSTGRLHATNCRFLSSQPLGDNLGNSVWSSGNVWLRNCLAVAPTAFCWVAPPEGSFVVENCIVVGKQYAHLFEAETDAAIRLVGNTLLNPCDGFGVLIPSLHYTPQIDSITPPPGPLRVVASSNVLDSPAAALQFRQSSRLVRLFDMVEAEAWLPRLVCWAGERNLFRAGVPLLWIQIGRKAHPATGRGRDLDDWNRFWGLADTKSFQGSIRYQGGNLHAKALSNPEHLTPEDFRLRSDSAGCQAGPGGEDLGAKVDLVGPGDAYNRWRETPDYQAWREETGEVMRVARAEAEAAAESRRPPSQPASESTPPDELPAAEKDAFVLLDSHGEEFRKFDTLADAVLSSSTGDTIEVRGNGPFITDPVHVLHRLAIRAADGFRPVIRANPTITLSENQPLLASNERLVLEGLDVSTSPGHAVSDSARLVISRGEIRALNCRLFFRPDRIGGSLHAQGNGYLRNCLLVGDGVVTWEAPSEGRFVVENCICVGGQYIKPLGIESGAALELVGNTLLRPNEVHGLLTPGFYEVPRTVFSTPPREPLRILASLNVLDWSSAAFQFQQLSGTGPYFDVAEAEALLPRLIRWTGERNLFRRGRPLLDLFITAKTIAKTQRGRDLEDWNRLWGLAETGSSQETIRYQGGDLHTKALETPEQLTPENFRLSPDSDGHQAGPDGKDLGADVDLVGPGEAYERWKKTAEYEEWREETRKIMMSDE